MRIAFDTSVLVAGVINSHPEFARASLWMDAADQGEIEAIWATHAYAEAWSVLTRLPLPTRLEPSVVNEVLQSWVLTAAPVDILRSDYENAARRCAAAGLRSGAIFDALHLMVAERMQVDAVLTLNLRDFLRLSPGVRVLAPPESLRIPDGGG